MSWTPYYRGTGTVPENRAELPAPPPWRVPGRPDARKRTGRKDPATTYRPVPGLVDAVNAALHLRRPLLLTGRAGSGKSTVIQQIATELELGDVLHWHITSRSTLAEALYRYDALGRIHAHNLRTLDGRSAHEGPANRDAPGPDDTTADGTAPDAGAPEGAELHADAPAPGNGDAAREKDAPAHDDDIGEFVQLGPLGTALLPGERPRALLIDEIDKSDLDLPSDLLDVLERGEFEIPELSRHPRRRIEVRTADQGGRHTVEDGWIQCPEFPVIVLTSNGERDFPAPFLRRCVRFEMPPLSLETLTEIVTSHLGDVEDATTGALVQTFLDKLNGGEYVAIDQLLSAVHLLGGDQVQDDEQRRGLERLLLQGLGRG
ncbi:ATPase [Streptomyces zhihengii]|uniref:ATPase n=1 Tax=Streptomyces zhihengii TaxID=1818004 RepID=UPI0036C60DD0